VDDSMKAAGRLVVWHAVLYIDVVRLIAVACSAPLLCQRFGH
jgi:hypothetical protein